MPKRTWVLRSRDILQNCEQGIEEAFDSGKLLRVTLELYHKPKTRPQVNTLHMWIGEIATHYGRPFNEIKQAVKDDWYPREEVFVMGQLRVLPKHTEDLSLIEMMDVMTGLQSQCAEYDIPITDPDPLHWQDKKQNQEIEQ